MAYPIWKTRDEMTPFVQFRNRLRAEMIKYLNWIKIHSLKRAIIAHD